MLRSPGQAEALISMCWITSFGVMQAQKFLVRMNRALKKFKTLWRMLQLHWTKVSAAVGNVLQGAQCCVAEGGGLFEQKNVKKTKFLQDVKVQHALPLTHVLPPSLLSVHSP